MRRFKLIGKFFGAVILAIMLAIVMSIPMAPLADNKVAIPGSKVERLVLQHANVLPMDSNYVLTNYSVFVEGNVITRLCSDSVANVEGFEVIDAGGQFILPGLVDMHAHVFDRSDLTNYLAYGVTQVRNMMGFPMHLRWKKQWAKGKFPGSEMITASPTLNFGNEVDPFHKKLGEKEDAASVVAQYQKDGYDFVKIYDGLLPGQFKSIMKKAKELNIPVAGHPPVEVPRDELINSQLISFEHIEEVYNTYMNRKKDDSLATAIAKEFSASGLPICVSLSAYHNIYRASSDKDFFKEIPLEQINPLLIFIGNRMLSDYVEATDQRKGTISAKRAYLDKLTKLFHNAGVPLIFGTDTGPNLTVPGYTVHQELQLLRQAGVQNFNILKSATLDAMKVLGKESQGGTIAVGKRAEFLLVGENPLTNLKTLASPNAIMANGYWYDSTAVKTLAKLGKDKSGAYVTFGNLFRQFFNK